MMLFLMVAQYAIHSSGVIIPCCNCFSWWVYSWVLIMVYYLSKVLSGCWCFCIYYSIVILQPPH